MNSPIKWVGGKRVLRKSIIPLIPKGDCYVEVFGGAGWVLFGKESKDHKVEVYNDIDSELVNFFNVIKYRSDEFKEKLNLLLISREVFDDLKFKDLYDLSELDRAFRFWYLLKYSYGGRKNTLTDYNFGYSKVRKAPIIEEQIKLIEESYHRLRGVTVENLSYEILMKKYDGENTVFYLDPPYIVNSKCYGKYEFTEEKHIELKKNLDNIKGKWILTVNNSDFFKELYKDYYIKEVLTNYSAGNSNKKSFEGKELIISNFKA